MRRCSTSKPSNETRREETTRGKKRSNANKYLNVHLIFTGDADSVIRMVAKKFRCDRAIFFFRQCLTTETRVATDEKIKFQIPDTPRSFSPAHPICNGRMLSSSISSPFLL